jgi:protein SCO1/2
MPRAATGWVSSLSRGDSVKQEITETTEAWRRNESELSSVTTRSPDREPRGPVRSCPKRPQKLRFLLFLPVFLRLSRDDAEAHRRKRGKQRPVLILVFLQGILASVSPARGLPALAEAPAAGVQTFQVKGEVKELKADGKTVVIAHEAIPNFMAAMTMPFKASEPKELAGLRVGDWVSFRLRVTEKESSIDQITRLGHAVVQEERTSGASLSSKKQAEASEPIRAYPFTNELGQAVRLNDFKGQALAIAFFFTRCPLPEFCPRLSKNFAEAQQKLAAATNAPANWHFLSVTFDPDFDTPQVLKSYGQLYQYDPRHWSFLTGPADKLRELAEGSGVQFERDGPTFNHNFRTLIIDAAGGLQMIFPTSGDLSDSIVTEILKAAAVQKAP